MKNKLRYLFVFFLFLPMASQAQCAMCRAVLESQGDTGAAEAINHGIMYLMIFPYLLMAGVGYFVWRSFQKKKVEE